MKYYLYIDTAEYIECMLTDYSALKQKTKDMTDFSEFEEVSYNPMLGYLDYKTSRIIYKNKSYTVLRNFMDIETATQFVILRESSL